MQTLLNILLAELQDKLDALEDTVLRDFTFPELKKHINIALGMRRTGKTTCVLQKIRSLLTTEQINRSQILYLNLEDDRLQPCSQEKLRQLIETFYSLYPENHEKTCYLFFDEIQNVDDWAVLIRRIFDTKKVKMYLTGSSAKLLNKEIHTALRGRSLASEVWPYSFKEYLRAQQISFKKNTFGKKIYDQLKYYLQTYLQTGGFPGILTIPEARRRELLQSYVDIVIARDIIDRHGITQITLLKYMIKTLLKNTGTSFAINKFFNDLKSQGLAGAKKTVYDYMQYIEDTYLCFLLPLYSKSIRQSQSNPRKIYAVDPGIARAYSFGLSQNVGHLFETMIYLDLRRSGHEIYYYLTQERHEIDFLAIDRAGVATLYQVAWDVENKKTLEREMRALTAAKKELNLDGTLITPEVYLSHIENKNFSSFFCNEVP